MTIKTIWTHHQTTITSTSVQAIQSYQTFSTTIIFNCLVGSQVTCLTLNPGLDSICYH